MSEARSFAVGTMAGVNPPLSAGRFVVRMARLGKLDSVLAPDHLISIFPRAIWDTEFTPQAKQISSPDEQFDYAPLLAHLAAGAGRVQLASGWRTRIADIRCCSPKPSPPSRT